MSKFTTILTTALLATATGVIAGVLIAPDSGKRTRKKLLKKARQFNDEFDELTYQSKEIIKDLKDSIEDIRYSAEGAINKAIKK